MLRNRERSDGGRIAARVRQFGEFVAAETPLYARICAAVADEPVIRRILADAPYDQPAANLLLGGVQYLLLRDPGAELATHYPGLAPDGSEPSGDLTRLFSDFCHAHEPELRAIAATRTVQTNEVGRCVALLPSFVRVAAASGRSLALLEIGASAGLNLLLDRYRYSFGPDLGVGPADSPVLLATDSIGDAPSVDPFPVIEWRLGIDVHPVDVTDSSDVRWLRALIWPEQAERARRFEAAVTLAQADPPRLVRGDAITALAAVTSQAPKDAALVVFHSFVLNQLSDAARTNLDRVMASVATTRPVFRIGIDTIARAQQEPSIRYAAYRSDGVDQRILGRVHHHGAWIDWSG